MKLSVISTAVALASTTWAAPTYPKVQLQIQTLQQQLIVISNDIVQSTSSLKSDYNAAATTFGPLSNRLAGPQPCSIFTPAPARNSNQALKALEKAQTSLAQLRSDLLDPSKSIQASDFHVDICQAQQYYSSISKFVGM